MKRPGKCVGKKSFAYSHLAIDCAKRQYINYGVELGFYECPTCLDFHLTSKYVNLNHLHPLWDQIKKNLEMHGKGNRKTRKKRLQRQRAKARKLLGIPPPIPKPREKKVWSGDIPKLLAPYQTASEVHKSPWWKFWSGIIGV